MDGRGGDIEKYDMFDKEANNEIDCLMSMIATTKYEAGE